MNDLSVASHFNSRNSKSDVQTLALPLANLCDASSQAADLLSPLPRVRQIAQFLLGNALRSAGADRSPDALFLNCRTMDGSLLSSVSLTEGMLQALVNGAAVLDSGVIAVYTRHDTVDAQFLAEHIDVQRVKEAFAQVGKELADRYIQLLDGFWTQPIANPGSSNHNAIPQQEWASLQRGIFFNEIEIAFLAGELDEQDRARLRKVLSHAMGEDAYMISLAAQDQPAALLHSGLVITRQPQYLASLTLENTQGSVFLLTALHGVEKFDSLPRLDEKLRERFSDPEQRGGVVDDILLKQAESLLNVTQVELEFRPCAGNPVQILAKALRVKQSEDCRFLLATAGDGESVSGFLQSISQCESLMWIDDARRRSVHAHMQRIQMLTTSDWLKFASDKDRKSYEVFESEYRLRAADTSRLLAGLESLEEYAIGKIDDYIRQRLGQRVDATQVMITLQDKWPSPAGELSAIYRKSLLEYALDGLPLTALESIAHVDLPPESTNPAFTFEFVAALIADLDLRYQYRRELEERYLQSDTQRALLHQRDSALALSTLMAQLQGHLFHGGDSNRAMELIWNLRGDREKPGSVCEMGALEVGGVGNQLRDAIVFSERTATDEFHVLYVPGAPRGRDMFVFGSWIELYAEVARWSGTPGGREYLIAKSAPVFREATSDFVKAAGRKASLWKAEDVRFIAQQPGSFQSNLSALINTRLGYEMSDLPLVVAGERKASTYSDRRLLALLNARIDFLNRSYEKHMKLVSYSDFARRFGESEIFKRTGQIIDPDTVYFDLQSRHRRSLPDFGPYTDLVSLTQLLMNDFTYKLDAQAPIYSSIGRNLSALTPEVIDEVLDEPLGEKYIDLLKQDYGNSRHPEYVKRRVLFAQRNYFEMHRDLLIASLESDISQAQYRWASGVLTSAFPGAVKTNAIPWGNSSLRKLSLNGRLIEGVLVFKNADSGSSDYHLVYTPNAPDGIRFRNRDEFISTLTSPGMDTYYYNRVSYKGQPSIGTFFVELSKNAQRALSSMTLDVEKNKVRDLLVLHDEMIKRMIQDVDEQTLSKAEAFADTLWTIVSWTGTILLIPFPPVALAWGLVGAAVSLTRGYLAYIDGDHATASRYYIFGTVGLVLAAAGAKDIAQSTTGLSYMGLRWLARKSHPGFA
jgi:hypothetical protein